MIKVGRYNDLKVIEHSQGDVIFDGEASGQIVMPEKLVRGDENEGESIHVFVYPDSSDRLIATHEKPFATVGEFAFLEVVLVNDFGAYLDWGVSRNLFVPIREQRARMRDGGVYLVYVAYNLTNGRVFGSARYDRFIDKGLPPYHVGESVEVMIAERTDLGFKTVIENQYLGMIYADELFDNLELGQICTAYIKKIRDDFKMDLSLSKIGFARIDDFSEELIERLKSRGGFIAVNDKSDAKDIYELFGVSKKTFKKSVGTLYRKRLITITDKGIELTTEE